VDHSLSLELRGKPAFVGRGGLKLEHALKSFAIDVTHRVCLDIGASTGGFTDCLLKRGAKRVFSVDVGYGQLDYQLKKNSRVVSIERTNARFLSRSDLIRMDSDAEAIDLLVIDVSFISLEKIIGPVRAEFTGLKDWILLFKPQFQVGKTEVGKQGLVKSTEATHKALQSFHDFMKSLDLKRTHGPESSPIRGQKSGNVEYLIHYVSA
jgi:23S rRNA (cytidine1920-2'-O)/16S rRNA (cytidine1409-2'-O)-methyltransferase